jgi:hypothetical protein
LLVRDRPEDYQPEIVEICHATITADLEAIPTGPPR